MSIDDYKMAQGPAKPATPEEIAKESEIHEVKDKFIGDGTKVTFDLSTNAISITEVTVDGVVVSSTDYKLDKSNLKVTFVTAAPANESHIVIEYSSSGYTYPNLHRRIDNKSTPLQEGEVAPDTYNLTVSGVNSYRTTESFYHDEDSTTSEIP